MMVSMGAVTPGTPVVTIVHDCQVLPLNTPSRAIAIPERGREGRRGQTVVLPSLHGSCEPWRPARPSVW